MRGSRGTVAGIVTALALLLAPVIAATQGHDRRGDGSGWRHGEARLAPDKDRGDGPRGGPRRRCRGGGTIIGAIAGGLLGGSGDRPPGAILGDGRAVTSDC